MNYRSILVHLDTSEQAHPRLELALRLAKHFDAHLTGMYSVFTPNQHSLYVMAGSAEYYGKQEQVRTERRGALERLFRSELTRAEVAGEWIAAGDSTNLDVPRRGRCADLIIVGQEDPSDPDAYVGDHFPASVVLSSGLPVLIVPYARKSAPLGKNVVFAWDGSREATRAAHDGLPFMNNAERTTVVTVKVGKDEPPGQPIRGADIAAVIARHGVNVEVATIESAAGTSIGDALLSKVSDTGADLLVMGGYGHARLRELVMGGATRTILQSMTVPVLMSH